MHGARGKIVQVNKTNGQKAMAGGKGPLKRVIKDLLGQKGGLEAVIGKTDI